MQRNFRLNSVSRIFLLLTLLIASLVICGWIFHYLPLVKLAPRLPPMVFNTALFFILTSFNLVFDRRKFLIPLSIINIALIVFSLLTIVEYAAFVDFGIDELFFKDTFRLDLTHPGRMGPNTAFGFSLISLAFLFRQSQHTRFRLRHMFPIVFFSFVVLTGLMSLIGFVFSAERGYIWGSFTRMALQTGLCFIFLGMAGLIENIRSLEYLNLIEKETKKLIMLVISAVIIATVSLWFLFCSLDAHKVKEIIKSENSRLQNNITLSLKDRLDSLERVVRRLEVGEINDKTWKVETDQLVKHFDGLESLSLVDKSGKILYSATDERVGDEIYSLINLPEVKANLKKAIQSEFPFYSNGFFDSKKRSGFFCVIPFFKDGIYNGALIGHFIGEDFFKALLEPQDHLITIKENDIVLFTNITPQTPVILEWGFVGGSDYKGIHLISTIVPAKRIISTHLGVTPTIILVIGVFLSILMAAFIAAIYELRISRNRQAYIGQWQRAILNGTDLGIVSTDTLGNVVLINPATEKLLGLSETEIIGKMSPVAWHDEQEVHKKSLELTKELGRFINPGVDTFFAKSIAGLPDKDQWTIYHKSGEAKKITLSVHALRSSEGEIDGFLGVMEDITEKQKQEQLIEEQRMKMVASSKMSSLGEMAAGIAHEINNPLTVIKGMAKMVKLSSSELDTDTNTIQKSADTIESTVNRIAKIIGSLKTFARDSEQEEFSFVRVSTILDETIPFCSERFKNLKINLMINCPHDIELYCRPIQISQVILNLLNNAYDAISHQEIKWVEISLLQKGEVVQISVTDSGAGISREVEEKMMQPFFTTKELGKGTGLGLSISAGIASSHKGRLYYDRDAENTRFVVELPLIVK